jgi:NitT/TauT family transport system substrate-binding protein
MSMTNLGLRIGFATCAVALASFGTTSAFAVDKLRLALPPAYTPIAAVVFAQEKGYFKEKDIEAEITVYRGGAAVQEAVAAGAADVAATASPGAAIAIQKGVKQKIVALCGPTAPNGWYLVVPSDSPIKSVKDLNGKKVGITGKGSSTDFLASLSAKNGGASIQSIPLGAGILPALKAKQIDAGVIWPLGSFHAVSSREYRLVDDYGSAVRNTSLDVWVASQETIDKRPDVLKRWIEALNKAVTEMQRDEAGAIAFLGKYHEEKDPKVLKVAYDTLIKTMRPDHFARVEWIDNALKLAAAGGVENLPRAGDIIDNRFTPAAK